MAAEEVVGAERSDVEQAPPPGNTARRGPAALHVLRHREFALFWAGQGISLVGTWMQGFAQGWLVQGLTTSAFALGLINFASSIPTLILMPLGGLAADRSERRQILIGTQWVMMLLAAITGWLIATHQLQLWHLYPIALALGVCTAFELPAYQSFYPQLVEREDLPRAIALNQAAFHGARIIGPAVAAWFVARWGTQAAFFANAASFLAVIATLSMIKRRPAAVQRAGSSAGAMIREGVQYVRQRPLLTTLLGITGITTFFVFPNLAVLMPYYASHILKTDARGMGLMMSASGIGSLLGAVLLLNVPRERRVLSIAVACTFVLVTLSALAWSHSVAFSTAVLLGQSLCLSFSVGLASVMIQEQVPDELRGRVMSLHSLTFTGIMPFAALIIPFFADRVGMRLELQVSAILYAAGALFLIWNLARQPEAMAEVPVT